MPRKKNTDLDSNLRKDLSSLGITGRKAQRIIKSIREADKKSERELVGVDAEVKKFFARL